MGCKRSTYFLIPAKKLDSFQRKKPDNALFPSVLGSMPKASVHPFCLETYDPNAQMHGRHFSSPFSGTVEQGQEIDRDGQVFVDVTKKITNWKYV
ncbi:hypothetical protein [Brevibacillus sp. SYSU BS000544]|uniref:hypothetical protein n=1 Tax=Brevibacillus sp. SYSU BS000544 TaxID=3416443 RepID=UPI003CE5176E